MAGFGPEAGSRVSPRVSVVMNCLNGQRYLRQALDSVFAQTYTDWEIVFWDNAGTDQSGDIAQSYGEKVRYFRAQSTTSLGQARIEAFARARGELVAMLDVDDLWEPEKLAMQVALYDANPALGLVYSDAILFDDAGGQSRFFEAVAPAAGMCFAELLASNFICTGTMLFSRKALAGVAPLFEPDMTMVMDYLLTLKIAYAHPLDYVNRPLVRHRVHEASESSRKWRLFSTEAKRMLGRLEEDLNGLRRTFGPQLDRAAQAADLQLALDAWSVGEAALAQQIARPSLGRSAALSMVWLGAKLYPKALPLERVREIKHALSRLMGRAKKPFRRHVSPS